MGLFPVQEPNTTNVYSQIYADTSFLSAVRMDIIFSVPTEGRLMVRSHLIQLLISHTRFSVTSSHITSRCHHQYPPPALLVSKPKAQALSQGCLDGLYGKRWERRSEEWITDPWQTNWLQAPPCIIVTGRTPGTRGRLITLSACVESLQVLKCHKSEQWICQCQLNKRHAMITHQLLWPPQQPVLRDAHEMFLPRS